jgi:mannose-1-phosphate guanylyltransferase
MAGGIGSRFWPVSREKEPKQFHDMLGIGRSLIQMTYDRFIQHVPAERIMVVTHEHYVSQVQAHLPEIPVANILAEPHRRNTAPCIAYATWRIYKENPNAICAMASADHLITNDNVFIDSITRAISQAEKSDDLLTVGIKPTRLDTGYGYIQFDAETPPNIEDSYIKKVKTFTEKPNAELAAEFLSSGEFYWNAGLFVWNVSAIMTAFKQYMPEMHSLFEEHTNHFGTYAEQEAVQKIYSECQSISIDYAIMEKANNVLMVKAEDFGWSDLGTWGSLYHHIQHDEFENAISSKAVKMYNAANNMVRLPQGKTAIIQGLDDYIVVDTGDVLLIVKKDQEQRIKDFVGDLKSAKQDHIL